jgi:hypothetical protein
MKFLQVLADENSGYYFTGIVGLVIGVLALALCLLWLFFPFIVITKFNDLIREVRALRGEIRKENADPPKADQRPMEEGKKPPPVPAAKEEVYRI